MIYTLHGWSYSKEVWKGTPFEGALHLELPGHGESQLKSTDLWDLSKEIGEMIGKGTTLVGWSLGATVVTLIAYNYPDKVERLILYAPTPLFKGISQPEIILKRFERRLRRDFKGAISFFRNLVSDVEKSIPKLNEDISRELLKSFIDFDCREALAGIDKPVKVIVGELDQITGLSGAFFTFKLLRRGDLRVIPKADHLTVLNHII